MSNSAHDHNGPTSGRHPRLVSKLGGQPISLERLEELLGKRAPIPEALAEPRRTRRTGGHGWKPNYTTDTRGESA